MLTDFERDPTELTELYERGADLWSDRAALGVLADVMLCDPDAATRIAAANAWLEHSHAARVRSEMRNDPRWSRSASAD